MREEKPKLPSQKNKSTKKNSWFWPAIYSGIAIVFVGMIWGYNAIIKQDKTETAEVVNNEDDTIIETNASKEVLKYPFNEDLLESVAILQEYYDAEAEADMRESALLVFNQTYVTNKGISISVNDEPFEVVAAMSGTVEGVIVDQFKGSEVTIAHADGKKTIYGSLTGVLVQEGDQVLQGAPLGTATSNEWNAPAGTHLHFQVQQDGVSINPRSLLAF
ncbi:M23 family metallopeptidase [Sporosarcina sp. Te-1]|uniref:M23 family metallopeptidase n=1 Tax=Sporosarcina sp. Te-1 TaxID=2818390 RepID=UPI001A9E12B1|nr:M23 family metallopeptidase [Sporosarcina sp. Te-1]QTD40773.1 M23 family metallopeptidase [Sporosarcina sp. Te-1]